MSSDIHSDQPMNQLSEAARETARRVSEAADETSKKATSTAKDISSLVEGVAADVLYVTKDALKGASDSAKDIYQSAAVKVEGTLETSRSYVRQNPLFVVAGAIALGAAIGCIVMIGRRKQTFGERYTERPLTAARDAIVSAFTPVAQRVHRDYDSARNGAGVAMDRLSCIGSKHKRGSLSHQIGRLRNNLRFW